MGVVTETLDICISFCFAISTAQKAFMTHCNHKIWILDKNIYILSFYSAEKTFSTIATVKQTDTDVKCFLHTNGVGC